MTDAERTVFRDAVAALAKFRATFACELRADSIAEMYVAEHLGLTVVSGNNPGFDALSVAGKRYQINTADRQALWISTTSPLTSFVLVSMDDSYSVTAMYRITQDQARTIFVNRAGVRKWQAPQAKLIAIAERIM
jgi:hypothetical protein